MKENLYLNHETRLTVAKTVARILKKSNLCPKRVVLFGSVARNEDTFNSDTDLLITHGNNHVVSIQYERKVRKLLEQKRIPVYAIPMKSKAGLVNLLVLDDATFNEPFISPGSGCATVSDYDFIMKIKSEGIEL